MEPKGGEPTVQHHVQPQMKVYRHVFSPKQGRPGPSDPEFKSGPSTKGRKSLLNSGAESLIGEVVGEGINLKNPAQHKAYLIQRDSAGVGR